MKPLATLLFAVLFVVPVQAATVLREWKADDLMRWSGGALKKQRLENGVLTLDAGPGDAMLISPVFEAFDANPSQRIELEMQSDVFGPAQWFWTGSTEGKFGGFSGEKTTAFSTVAGGFTTYHLEPFWQAEKRILRLRLDFPEQQAGHYIIKALRIVEEAPSAPLALPLRAVPLENGLWRGRLNWLAEQGSFATVRMTTPLGAGQVGALSFASDAVNGLHRVTFPLRADGQAHTYNIDMGADVNWRGHIIELRLQPVVGQKTNAQIASLSLGTEPQGPADLQVTFLGLHDPMARSGKPVKLEAIIVNHGGEAAQNLKAQLKVNGARLLSADAPPAQIEYGVPEKLSWIVQADKPNVARATLTLPGATAYTTMLDFRAPLNLPKAAYVPVPKPAKSDYLVGAYYFPGWNTASRWAPLRAFSERQPLLGWYHEGDPEVADWHIKWAVEHGINFFLYDWYWDRGARQLEHGLEALFKARYSNALKFCLLYANHNSAGSHSAEDFEQITKFWIDNYFKRPNYLKVDGKPIVVMFAAQNPAHDMGVENVKATFEKMRALCREAGFKGLYLVACSNDGTGPLAQLKAMGYDAVTAYNWPALNMTSAETAAHRASYETNIEGYKAAWQRLAEADVLKLIPPVAAGWDSRPWAGDKALVRYGRTPQLFKRHLQDAKQFLDTREQNPKLKMLLVEAWNELGEGSYIEPHREFGFGYLEAIREVFAPQSAKPQEILPSDIGLGPYDVAREPTTTQWNFVKAKTPLGWEGNIAKLRIEDGALYFTTRGNDPILGSPSLLLRAARYPNFVMKIKASRDVDGQLFWSTTSSPLSEANSVRFAIEGDGKFHEIKVRLADKSRWRGVITGLRFDPGSFDNVEIEIESILLGNAP